MIPTLRTIAGCNTEVNVVRLAIPCPVGFVTVTTFKIVKDIAKFRVSLLFVYLNETNVVGVCIFPTRRTLYKGFARVVGE